MGLKRREEEREDVTFEASSDSEPLKGIREHLEPTGYRVGGDMELLKARLEEELVRTRAAKGELERELYAVRRARRAQRTSRAASFAGFGSLVGALLGLAVYAAVGNPIFSPVLTIVGSLMGALAGGSWLPPDDNFPAAPPPRMM